MLIILLKRDKLDADDLIDVLDNSGDRRRRMIDDYEQTMKGNRRDVKTIR